MCLVHSLAVFLDLASCHTINRHISLQLYKLKARFFNQQTFWKTSTSGNPQICSKIKNQISNKIFGIMLRKQFLFFIISVRLLPDNDCLSRCGDLIMFSLHLFISKILQVTIRINNLSGLSSPRSWRILWSKEYFQVLYEKLKSLSRLPSPTGVFLWRMVLLDAIRWLAAKNKCCHSCQHSIDIKN